MSTFGLNEEQLEYAEQLVGHAAWGAWVSDAEVVGQSRAYADGQISDAPTQRTLLSKLLYLAAHDPEHEWEAPTLTGFPTSLAVEAYRAISSSC